MDAGISFPGNWKHETKCEGSSIEMLIDDVQKANLTDTSITTGTRIGMYGGAKDRTTHFNADQIIGADLAAAATSLVLPRRDHVLLRR